MSTVSRDPAADPRLADDRDITYLVTMSDGLKHRWTGTPDLINQAVKVRSGPMLLLADDGTLLNYAHVIRMTPLGQQ